MLVSADRLSKTYRVGKRSVTALDGVSMAVEAGEFVALAGPSGSGKSTLLNLIGCLDTPSSGSLRVAGESIVGLEPNRLADLRSRLLGFVFQNFNLLPVLSALENIEYPLVLHEDLDRRQRHERACSYLDMVGLGEFRNHRPGELSGGQQQRVAIARALATRPALVLADEPTANLDHRTGRGIIGLMRRFCEEEGTTFIFSTHDPQIIAMADRVVELEDGRVLRVRGAAGG